MARHYIKAFGVIKHDLAHSLCEYKRARDSHTCWRCCHSRLASVLPHSENLYFSLCDLFSVDTFPSAAPSSPQTIYGHLLRDLSLAAVSSKHAHSCFFPFCVSVSIRSIDYRNLPLQCTDACIWIRGFWGHSTYNNRVGLSSVNCVWTEWNVRGSSESETGLLEKNAFGKS